MSESHKVTGIHVQDPPRKVYTKDLQLGDFVRPTTGVEDSFRDGVVCKVTPEYVSIFRPYVRTEDFSMSGGTPDSSAVITYIGAETYSVFKDSAQSWILFRRQTLR